jgi:hypothetical protein
MSPPTLSIRTPTQLAPLDRCVPRSVLNWLALFGVISPVSSSMMGRQLASSA